MKCTPLPYQRRLMDWLQSDKPFRIITGFRGHRSHAPSVSKKPILGIKPSVIFIDEEPLLK